ncbi:MAG: hypothetical protein FWE24_11510, partial [Defluviitaleaceae bacterium]|nr:hypothetical protein [Defluviitaleaceae bacterium]
YTYVKGSEIVYIRCNMSRSSGRHFSADSSLTRFSVLVGTLHLVFTTSGRQAIGRYELPHAL